MPLMFAWDENLQHDGKFFEQQKNLPISLIDGNLLAKEENFVKKKRILYGVSKK